MTSPAPDVWLSILTDYTYDSELDIADGVPLAFRRSSMFPEGNFCYHPVFLHSYVVCDQLMHDNEVSVVQAECLDAASALLFEVVVFCQEVSSVISSRYYR